MNDGTVNAENFHGMYCVYDSKAEAYGSPFCMQNDDLAKRQLWDTVNSGNHVFSQHSEDFTLFRIGYFDEKSGGLYPSEALVSLCNLVELKENAEK